MLLSLVDEARLDEKGIEDLVEETAAGVEAHELDLSALPATVPPEVIGATAAAVTYPPDSSAVIRRASAVTCARRPSGDADRSSAVSTIWTPPVPVMTWVCVSALDAYTR